jgi:hypothetical protein
MSAANAYFSFMPSANIPSGILMFDLTHLTENSAHLLCGVEIMKQFSPIAKKRPELSAAMTVVAMLAAGAIAKFGAAVHLLQLIH